MKAALNNRKVKIIWLNQKVPFVTARVRINRKITQSCRIQPDVELYSIRSKDLLGISRAVTHGRIASSPQHGRGAGHRQAAQFHGGRRGRCDRVSAVQHGQPFQVETSPSEISVSDHPMWLSAKIVSEISRDPYLRKQKFSLMVPL